MASPATLPSSATTTVASTRQPTGRAGPSGTLPLHSSPAETGDASGDGEEPLTDSGYGSHETIQAASSDTWETVFNVFFISDHESTKHFSFGLDQVYSDYVNSIDLTLRIWLAKHFKPRSLLRSRKPRYCPFSCRAMLLGSTRREAKPYIVISCPLSIQKKVQVFIDTDKVIQAARTIPDQPGLLTFGVLASGRTELEQVNGDFGISVVWDTYLDEFDFEPEEHAQIKQLGGEPSDVHNVSWFHARNANRPKMACISCTKAQKPCDKHLPSCRLCLFMKTECHYPKEGLSTPESREPMVANAWFETKTLFPDTVCGTPIQFNANGRTSNATVGGIIKVEYEDGSWDLKGLTAAHAAMTLLPDDTFGASIVSDDHGDDEESGSDTNIDGAVSSHSEGPSPWAFESPKSFGEPLLACPVPAELQSSTVQEGVFFDWALTSLSVFKMNLVPGRGEITALRRLPSKSVAPYPEPVIVLCGSSGMKRGHLLRERSYTLLGPASAFTTTHMVQLPGGCRMARGDSGSWVVSETTLELLGHIVAGDNLSTGYFIPVQDIFDDIVRSTSVVAVGLPEAEDIEEKCLQWQWDVQAQARARKQQQSQDGKGKQERRLSLASTIEDPDHPGMSDFDDHAHDSTAERHKSSTSITFGKGIMYELFVTTSSLRFSKELNSIVQKGHKDILFARAGYWTESNHFRWVFTFEFSNEHFRLMAEDALRAMRHGLERDESVAATKRTVPFPYDGATTSLGSTGYDNSSVMDGLASMASASMLPTEASFRREEDRLPLSPFASIQHGNDSGFASASTSTSAAAGWSSVSGSSSSQKRVAPVDESVWPALNSSGSGRGPRNPFLGSGGMTKDSAKIWNSEDVFFGLGGGGWHYASSLGSILLDDREAERRPRFLPSNDWRSTAPSIVDTRISASGRGGGGGGGGYGSIFSDHDGMTKASITTSDSVAQRAMNAALLADIDELPESVTVEDSAPANLGMQDHWYHTGAALTTTGAALTMASASAIRAYAQRAQPGPMASDATAVVAYMPCEFSWYKDCAKTFPLYASEAGIDEWTDHMVLDRTHLNSRLPQNAGCWFCPEKFDIGRDSYQDSIIRIEVYKRRMRHIAWHFLKGEKLPETRLKDEGFERHLIQNHIWRAPQETGPTKREEDWK